MKDKKFLKGSGINWNQVYYFSEVATAGSIKDAAPKLGITSSTLSEHIGQLERDLDVLLFHRHHRKLTLTDQGNKLFQYAKQMFETGQRLIDEVSPIPLGCYPVSIGLVPSPSIQIGYRFIRSYVAQAGAFNMKFFHSSHDDLERGLNESRYDFGFSDRIPERKNIVYELISSSTISFYVSAQRAQEKFKDVFAQLPLLVCNSDPGSRSAIEQALEERDLNPLCIMSADYPSLLLDLCEAGLGIAAFSEESAKILPLAIATIKTPRDTPRINHRLYVLWSKDGENSEAVKRLRELLSSASFHSYT